MCPHLKELILNFNIIRFFEGIHEKPIESENFFKKGSLDSLQIYRGGGGGGGVGKKGGGGGGGGAWQKEGSGISEGC